MSTLLATSAYHLLLGNNQGEMFTLSRQVQNVDGTWREARTDHCDRPKVSIFEAIKVPGHGPCGCYIGCDRHHVVILKRFRFDNLLVSVGFDEVNKEWWIYDSIHTLPIEPTYTPVHQAPIGEAILDCPNCDSFEEHLICG